LVSDACLTARALFLRVEWIAYEEVADAEPGAVQERLASLLRHRILASPFDAGAEGDATRAHQRALAARNSLAAEVLAGQVDALPSRPERYWRLSWRRELA